MDTGYGQLSLMIDMKSDHRIVIHLIDMISGKDQGQVWLAIFHPTEVLLHGIGGTQEPIRRAAGAVRGINAYAAGEIAVQVPGTTGTDVIGIAEGVRPGDKVITLSAFPIRDGQLVVTGGRAARRGRRS